MFIVSSRRLKKFVEQLSSDDAELNELIAELKLKRGHKSNRIRISQEVQEHLDLMIKAEVEKGIKRMKERRQITLTKSCFE